MLEWSGCGSRILQQVAERSQRVTVSSEALDHGGERRHEPLTRPRHTVRVVEIEYGSGSSATKRAAHLHRRGSGPSSLGLHGPEDAGRAELFQDRKEREIGHAPGRPEDA